MSKAEPLTCELRRPLAAAIAWQLLAELTRRYGGKLSLRILEMHPGGGSYDLLTMWGTADDSADVYTGSGQQLLGLNLSGSAHRQPSDDRRFAWLSRWLGATDVKDVVDELASFAGFPLLTRSAPTTRHVFGSRLIAGLLGAHAMSRDPLDGRMGFCDTSGYGSGVLPEVRELVGSQLRRETDAARWWLVRRWLSDTPVALVSIDGWIVSATTPSPGVDLYSRYADGQDMETVLREANKLMTVSLAC